MPTALDSGSQPSTGKFCEDFLNAGGLGLVVNILQRDAMPPDVDYETRQGCYAISLQLLRLENTLTSIYLPPTLTRGVMFYPCPVC